MWLASYMSRTNAGMDPRKGVFSPDNTALRSYLTKIYANEFCYCTRSPGIERKYNFGIH